MGFFNFLGTTLSGGGEAYSKAVSDELANYRERGMQPYDRSIKRDAAIQTRVQTDQLTKNVAATERQIATTAAAAGRGPAIDMPNTGFNTSAVVDPAAQPMPTAPAPTPQSYDPASFTRSKTDYFPDDAAVRDPTLKEALAGARKFDRVSYDPQFDKAKLAELEQQYAALMGSTRGYETSAQRKELKAQIDNLRAVIKDGGKRRPAAISQKPQDSLTSFPTDLRPTGDKPQVTGVPAQGPTFDEAMVAIKKFEGDLSMNPDDNGNWTGGKKGVGQLKGTKYGISAAAYPDLDIKSLTPEQAKQIYKRDYWDKIGADNLPGNVRLSVFDAAVNQGPKFATDTLAATGGDPAAFAEARKQRYADIAANNPSQQQFLDGWNSRAEAAASLTPVEALQQGGGNVGLNTQPYMDDPNRASLDLQITEFYQQQQQSMFDMVGSELAYAQENAADMARTMGPSQYREYLNGLRKQQMEVSLAAMQSRTTGAMLYAYQGLNLAQGGKTGLLNLALTEITGVQTEIVPRSSADGTPLFYSLAIAGQPVGEPMPYDQLVQEVRTRIDRGYAEALMSAQAEAQRELSQTMLEHRNAIELRGVDARVAVIEQAAQMRRELTVEEFKSEVGSRYEDRQKDAEGNPIYYDRTTGKLVRAVLRTDGKGSKAVDTLILEPYLTEG